MIRFIAALPMYDWPEARAEVDAEWSRIAGLLRSAGISPPERLIRRNADMPPVRNGIRDAAGRLIAPDPGTLAAAAFDLQTLWLHPDLLFAQTCWGPMEQGLSAHVSIVAQPDYSPYEGGDGEFYSSVILAREGRAVPPPPDGQARLPLGAMRGRRLAYNSADSMSGILALSRDLAVEGASLDTFSEKMATGGHRASIQAVAGGQADICAIDCRTWALARRFEPAANAVRPVGWTARRKGLPYIVAGRHANLYRDIELVV